MMFSDGLTPRPARILVVDDQPINIQVLYQVFHHDHQVLMATNGQQALKIARTQHPDLVLLDVEMPGMDGHEVCRRLKADRDTAQIPIIFVTAHREEAEETLGLELGAVDFIGKPINPAIVRARARTHLTLKAQADQLRRWVFIDGLTAIGNRRHLDTQLSTEWRRAKRNGSDLSLLMIDVDHFKRFNDRYGHQAGDECLRRLAGTLRETLRRPADLVARYGGEEFACLLPETPFAGARQIAETLRRKVESLAIPHADSDTAACVTISLGFCTHEPLGPTDEEQFMRAVDEQLYAANHAGRNCVCGRIADAQTAPATTD